MPYTTILTTDTLAAHLADPGADPRWLVVDCRFDLQNEELGRTQYLAAHVPGAVYASLAHDLAGKKSGTNGRHPLPAVEDFTATLRRLGVNRDTQVVAYDQDAGMYASRFWWMLRYAGHDAVAVLDGGWAKWTTERRATRGGDEQRAAGDFIASLRPSWRLTADEIAALPESMLLVDARGPERYEGRSEPLDRVAGHIPGAANHYYKQNLTDAGTMLPPDTLRHQYGSLLDGRSPEQVVMYCGSGVSACHNLLAMQHAGLGGARLYPGSWSEWSADPSRPVETGAGGAE
jgi:thiosulfate/3-mercaptopyruvate sulfurtransferase